MELAKIVNSLEISACGCIAELVYLFLKGGLDWLDWLDWLDGPMSQQSGSSLIYLQKKTRSFPLMGL